MTSLSSHQTRLGDPFEPCAATATYFLYAQHNIIRCLHHDTLAIERKFERHTADVLLIYADNISERGAGRLVVSYDAEQTAIIWDLLTGDEVARFASYEVIRVAAWLKDGTIAFGAYLIKTVEYYVLIVFQETAMATSFCSTLRALNMFLLAQYSIPSPHWHLPLTARLMPLG